MADDDTAEHGGDAFSYAFGHLFTDEALGRRAAFDAAYFRQRASNAQTDDQASAQRQAAEEIMARLQAQKAEELRRLIEEAMFHAQTLGMGGLGQNPYQAPTQSAERAAAIAKLRSIKALRDRTDKQGERASAQAAMDRIMAKHGIIEGEL